MERKNIVVASENPVKMDAAEAAFHRMFPDWEIVVSGISVPSGVSNQPMGDEETRKGALQRVRSAKIEREDADFWVGIEGGVIPVEDSFESFAWVVISGSDGRTGASRTGTFALPQKVAALIRQGMELGQADDVVFGKTGSKTKNGAVGILTGNVIDRRSYYEQAAVLALVPFRNPDLFPL